MGASLVAFAVAPCRRGAAVQASRCIGLSGGAGEGSRKSEQHCGVEKSPRAARWAERATNEKSVRPVARKNRWLVRLILFVTWVIGLGGSSVRGWLDGAIPDGTGASSNMGFGDQNGAWVLVACAS